jgi:hypothetical protein
VTRQRSEDAPVSGRTWLVECYGPGIDADAVAAASDRARTAVEIARRRGAAIEYLGALLIAADEAVFHAFAADDGAEVERASADAGLAHARVVESIGISSPSLVDAMTRLLVAARPTATKRAT